MIDLRGRNVQYQTLQRDADTNRSLYDALLQRYKEIGIAGGVGTNNVSIVDAGLPAGSPVTPRTTMNLLLGLLLGALIGAAVAFMLEQLDEIDHRAARSGTETRRAAARQRSARVRFGTVARLARRQQDAVGGGVSVAPDGVAADHQQGRAARAVRDQFAAVRRQVDHRHGGRAQLRRAGPQDDLDRRRSAQPLGPQDAWLRQRRRPDQHPGRLRRTSNSFIRPGPVEPDDGDEFGADPAQSGGTARGAEPVANVRARCSSISTISSSMARRYSGWPTRR